MSRNRLKNSQSLHWVGVTKWVLIASLACILALSYMLCQNQNIHMAETNRKLEKSLAEIQQHNRQLEIDLDRMQTQTELRRRLAQINSSLVDVNQLTQIPMEQSTRSRLAHNGLYSTVADGGRQP